VSAEPEAGVVDRALQTAPRDAGAASPKAVADAGIAVGSPTGPDGRFLVAGLDAGRYRLRVTGTGLLAAVIVLVAVGSATDFQLMRHNALPTVLLFYAFLAGGRRYAVTGSAGDER